MSCICDKLPDFEVYLVPYRRGGYRPWTDSNAMLAGVPAPQYEVSVGRVAHNYGLQAYNTVPGDVLFWEFSFDNGATWVNISSTGTGGWGVPNGKVCWTEEDSILANVHVPNGVDANGRRFRLTVSREGCDPMVSEHVFTVIGGNVENGLEANQWYLYLDGVIHCIASAAGDWKRTPEQAGIDRTLWEECGFEKEYIGSFEMKLNEDLLDCVLRRMYCMDIKLASILEG